MYSPEYCSQYRVQFAVSVQCSWVPWREGRSGLLTRLYLSLMLDSLTEFSYACVYYITSCHGCLAEHTHNLSAKSVLPILFLCYCTLLCPNGRMRSSVKAIRKALYNYKPFIFHKETIMQYNVCTMWFCHLSYFLDGWVQALWSVTPHITSL